MGVLLAWLMCGILPLLVSRALEPYLPDSGFGNVCVLAALPLLLVIAVVLEIGLGYW
jgi:hypothetical protein